MQTVQPTRRTVPSLAALTGVILSALVSLPSAAQDPDRVVATANGQPITEGEAAATLARMPPQFQQQPLPMVLPMIVQQIAIGRLIGERALEEGLGEDEEVKQRLEEAEAEIIQNIWIERQLTAAVTDEAVEAEYEAYKLANPPADQVKARHILLESAEDATAVIEALNNGGDFETLAAEKSIGPSGPNGGDLGYFTKGDMVPEFAEAAFSLEPGSITETPVQTQFGWHVIKVEDRRTTAPPTLEEIRPELENSVRQTQLRTVINDIQSKADIVFLDQDGNPIEEETEAGEEEVEEGEAAQ